MRVNCAVGDLFVFGVLETPTWPSLLDKESPDPSEWREVVQEREEASEMSFGIMEGPLAVFILFACGSLTSQLPSLFAWSWLCFFSLLLLEIRLVPAVDGWFLSLLLPLDSDFKIVSSVLLFWLIFS